MSNNISDLQDKKKRQNRWWVAGAVIFVLLVSGAVLQKRMDKKDDLAEKPMSQFNLDLDAGKVKAIKVVPDFLSQGFEIELKAGEKYKFTGPHIEVKDAKDWADRGVVVDYKQPATDWRGLPSYLMFVVLMMFIVASVGQSLGLSFMRAARRSTVRFADVAGNEEAKGAMDEVVAYLGNPRMYEEIGARFPKGIMMDGPPGTGKTLLAKAIAGEAGASFLAVSGSDFSSMFVGVSGMKVRGMFARARRSAPCVLFIDEIDAIGGHRLSEGSAVAREMGSTLNSLLVQMDGFVANSGVIVIAATNRIELLDPALLRSGRFDRHIHVQLPTLVEREQILMIHAKPVKLGDFDIAAVAKACIGMSGADLSNVMNQAALIAVREGTSAVTTKHALQGRDRVIMGDPRMTQARAFSESTRRLLAVHETGHAIVGMVWGPDPITRVSIIPRGKSLGQTMMTPDEDNLIIERQRLVDRVRVLLGGRAAEMTVANTQTTGALQDLEIATRLSSDLMGRFGMDPENLYHVGGQVSDSLRREVEAKANALMLACLKEAQQTIQTYRAIFDAMVDDLMAHEEIDEAGVQTYVDLIKPAS